VILIVVPMCSSSTIIKSLLTYQLEWGEYWRRSGHGASVAGPCEVIDPSDARPHRSHCMPSAASHRRPAGRSVGRRFDSTRPSGSRNLNRSLRRSTNALSLSHQRQCQIAVLRRTYTILPTSFGSLVVRVVQLARVCVCVTVSVFVYNFRLNDL